MIISMAIELLRLNRFFLAISIVWAFVLAYLALALTAKGCYQLYTLMWVFFVFGFVACLADFIFEMIQDSLYACPKRGKFLTDEDNHRRFNAPTQYVGVRWGLAHRGFWGWLMFWGTGKYNQYDTLPMDHKVYTCSNTTALVLLYFEALLRFAGNLLLFCLFVLTGLGDYTEPGGTCPCIGQPLEILRPCYNHTGLSWTQQVMPLFWTCVALTLVRIIFFVTYPDYAPSAGVRLRSRLRRALQERQERYEELELLAGMGDAAARARIMHDTENDVLRQQAILAAQAELVGEINKSPIVDSAEALRLWQKSHSNLPALAQTYTHVGYAVNETRNVEKSLRHEPLLPNGPNPPQIPQPAVVRETIIKEVYPQQTSPRVKEVPRVERVVEKIEAGINHDEDSYDTFRRERQKQ